MPRSIKSPFVPQMEENWHIVSIRNDSFLPRCIIIGVGKQSLYINFSPVADYRSRKNILVTQFHSYPKMYWLFTETSKVKGGDFETQLKAI